MFFSVRSQHLDEWWTHPLFIQLNSMNRSQTKLTKHRGISDATRSQRYTYTRLLKALRSKHNVHTLWWLLVCKTQLIQYTSHICSHKWTSKKIPAFKVFKLSCTNCNLFPRVGTFCRTNIRASRRVEIIANNYYNFYNLLN